MYNFILDSDALIKLTYAEIIIDICKNYNCFITTKVKDEVIEEGKKRFYQDALIIEKLVKNKLLKIIDGKKLKIKEVNLGKGEISTLELYHSKRNSIIITDDLTFIKYLERKNIQYLIPATLILLLKKKKIIDLKQTIIHLEKLKPFIKEEVYKDIKKEIKGG